MTLEKITSRHDADELSSVHDRESAHPFVQSHETSLHVYRMASAVPVRLPDIICALPNA